MWEQNLSVYGADKIWDQLNKDGITVARCTDEELADARHLEDLPRRDECYVWIDAAHRGVGSGAVGPDTCGAWS